MDTNSVSTSGPAASQLEAHAPRAYLEFPSVHLDNVRVPVMLKELMIQRFVGVNYIKFSKLVRSSLLFAKLMFLSVFLCSLLWGFEDTLSLIVGVDLALLKSLCFSGVSFFLQRLMFLSVLHSGNSQFLGQGCENHL
jgi:hypothetical protein